MNYVIELQLEGEFWAWRIRQDNSLGRRGRCEAEGLAGRDFSDAAQQANVAYHTILARDFANAES